MDKDLLNSTFYINEMGEILAFVKITKADGTEQYRIIENIETMRYSPNGLLEESLHGFDGYPWFDTSKYAYRDLSYYYDILESGDWVNIASVWSDCAGVDLDAMDEKTKALFASIIEFALSNEI